MLRTVSRVAIRRRASRVSTRRAFSSKAREREERSAAKDRKEFLADFPARKFNMCFNMCQQGHTAVITRFGKLHTQYPPGWYLAIPFVDRIHNVDQRELTIRIDPQTATTKDNVSVDIGGSLFVQVTDPTKACFGATQPLFLAEQQAQAIMRSGIGKVTLDELFHDRSSLNNTLREQMQNAADEWGLLIKRYELTTVRPDLSVSHAMDKQAVAERSRREQILAAEAEKRSKVLVSEGRRQELINEAEGHKAETILRAEAQREESIRHAEGVAESTRIKAQAQAEAIERIAAAIDSEEGYTAMSYTNAQEYMKMMTQNLSEGNKTTMIIPQDLNNVEGIVARGMAIASNMSKPERKSIHSEEPV